VLPQTELVIVGKSDETGTEVTFYPDASSIFETITFNHNTILDRMRHAAYLTKGIERL
jgi:DNA gyrase subunit B